MLIFVITQVPHKPYPKSDRKRQLQQYGRRNHGSDSDQARSGGNPGLMAVKGTPPPVKAKPPHGVPQNGRLVLPPGVQLPPNFMPISE